MQVDEIPPPVAIVTNENERSAIPRPWHRWFARVIDTWMVALLLGIVSGLTGFSKLFDNNFVAAIVISLALVLVDTLLMPTAGATLGKALFNIQVREPDGRKLDWPRSLRRAIDVWYFGEAFGLPLISLIAMSRRHQELKKNGVTVYDANRDYRVTHGAVDLPRVFGIFVAAVVLIGVLFLGAAAKSLP